MKRVVKYRKGYDMWTYVAGEKKLPGAPGFDVHAEVLLTRAQSNGRLG